MPRGLDGRRLAMAVGTEVDAARAESIGKALSNSGAQLHRLDESCGAEEFQSTRYAGLILVGDDSTRFEAPASLLQLARECLASDKPVAALGSGVALLLEAGGSAGRSIAADDALRAVLEGSGATVVGEPTHQDDAIFTARSDAAVEMVAERLVAALSNRLEESEVDDMSAMSFPASDPPAVSPATIGPAPDANA